MVFGFVGEDSRHKGGLWSTFLQWMKCMNGMDGLCEGHGPKGPISVVNQLSILMCEVCLVL